ncbi:MAG: SagB/ThcOx family dehydrogenase [Clostridiales bacterium]|jgi:SagB-type dehydrogenase family enzyme|nr:SagB/ThcOx family dehydrogenase [Clostridiales bacterium]
MKSTDNNRNFLKAYLWDKWGQLDRDQEKGVPAPPFQKPYGDDASFVELIKPEDFNVGNIALREALGRRRSRRRFTGDPLTLEELSWLLWSAQGVTGDNEGRRTAPSAGGRHPFETYLAVNRVEGLRPGLYRYLPFEHRLLVMGEVQGLEERMAEVCHGQKFVAGAAVAFFWTALPYRAEWCYSLISHKMIAIDAGHLCQNLYLACEAIDAGVCAIGKYSQHKMDHLLGVDGTDEFAIYGAVVGKTLHK